MSDPLRMPRLVFNSRRINNERTPDDMLKSIWVSTALALVLSLPSLGIFLGLLCLTNYQDLLSILSCLLFLRGYLRRYCLCLTSRYLIKFVSFENQTTKCGTWIICLIVLIIIFAAMRRDVFMTLTYSILYS
jgi:hypothetical protein